MSSTRSRSQHTYEPLLNCRQSQRGAWLPCNPTPGKGAFLKGWPGLATADAAQIEAWAAKFPDYNCGVAGGADVTILDSDRVSRLKELCGVRWSDWFHTYSVSSGRPDRAHFYFLTTPEIAEFGNRKHEEPGVKGNVFEIKGKGTQATAEGSIHPDTGGRITSRKTYR